MPQSLSRVLVHLVFSTKTRRPLIAPAVRDDLWKYITGTLNGLNCPALAVGGMPDHVHALFGLARTASVADVVEEVKKASSKWAKDRIDPAFYWQGGYGAFSVSSSNAATVVAYIRTQDRRHRQLSFQDEFRELLRRHEIAWDERYVWD